MHFLEHFEILNVLLIPSVSLLPKCNALQCL